MDITSDLKGWWTFDDSGATTQDFSGNSNTGTLTGGPPVRVQGMNIGSVLKCNGTSDYVSIAANSSIGNLTSSLTIAAWVLMTALPSDRYAIFAPAESPSGAIGFVFNILNTTGLLEFVSSGVQAYQSATAIVPVGIWTHIALTFDSLFDVIFFINGVQKDTITHSAGGAVANTTQAMFIGAAANNTSTPTRWWLDGKVDEVRIYGRVLTAAELAALYLFTNIFPEPGLTKFPKPLLQFPIP